MKINIKEIIDTGYAIRQYMVGSKLSKLPNYSIGGCLIDESTLPDGVLPSNIDISTPSVLNKQNIIESVDQLISNSDIPSKVPLFIFVDLTDIPSTKYVGCINRDLSTSSSIGVEVIDISGLFVKTKANDLTKEVIYRLDQYHSCLQAPYMIQIPSTKAAQETFESLQVAAAVSNLMTELYVSRSSNFVSVKTLNSVVKFLAKLDNIDVDSNISNDNHMSLHGSNNNRCTSIKNGEHLRSAIYSRADMIKTLNDYSIKDFECISNQGTNDHQCSHKNRGHVSSASKFIDDDIKSIIAYASNPHSLLMAIELSVIPATVKGVMILLLEMMINYDLNIQNKVKGTFMGTRIAIVGCNSKTVGLYLSRLLLGLKSTVTLFHSGSILTTGSLSNQDIIISCVGIPKLITKEMILTPDELSNNEFVEDEGYHNGTATTIAPNIPCDLSKVTSTWSAGEYLSVENRKERDIICIDIGISENAATGKMCGDFSDNIRNVSNVHYTTYIGGAGLLTRIALLSNLFVSLSRSMLEIEKIKGQEIVDADFIAEHRKRVHSDPDFANSGHKYNHVFDKKYRPRDGNS